MWSLLMKFLYAVEKIAFHACLSMVYACEICYSLMFFLVVLWVTDRRLLIPLTEIVDLPVFLSFFLTVFASYILKCCYWEHATL